MITVCLIVAAIGLVLAMPCRQKEPGDGHVVATARPVVARSCPREKRQPIPVIRDL